MSQSILCVIFTAALGIIFKLSERHGGNTRIFIPINYLCCFCIGLFYSGPTALTELPVNWFVFAFIMGCLFLAGFSLFAYTIKLTGISVATLFQKMSVMLTLLVAFCLGKTMNITQVTGIILGIIAMLLILKINPFKFNSSVNGSLFLIASLVCASLIEIGFLIHSEYFNFDTHYKVLFQSIVFLSAGIAGIVYSYWIQKDLSIIKKDLLFGLLLGIPNFYSIYFLIQTLDLHINGALFFPVLNISVIAITFICGYFFFKERLDLRQLGGLILSLVAILLIYHMDR